jgi:hypothetical protein
MLESKTKRVKQLLLNCGIPSILKHITDMPDFQSMPRVCNKCKKVMKEIAFFEKYYANKEETKGIDKHKVQK